MNCLPDLPGAYLDDELDVAQRVAFERHMGECATCADAYASLGNKRTR
jgi:anti-sigma factor RsiW